FSRDWSSDVCSSDLMKRTILIACGALILTAGGLQLAFGHQDAAVQDAAPANPEEARKLAGEIAKAYKNAKTLRDTVRFEISGPRAEERRVGKEGRSR